MPRRNRNTRNIYKLPKNLLSESTRYPQSTPIHMEGIGEGI